MRISQRRNVQWNKHIVPDFECCFVGNRRRTPWIQWTYWIPMKKKTHCKHFVSRPISRFCHSPAVVTSYLFVCVYFSHLFLHHASLFTEYSCCCSFSIYRITQFLAQPYKYIFSCFYLFCSVFFSAIENNEQCQMWCEPHLRTTFKW